MSALGQQQWEEVRLREIRKEKGLTQAELAQQSGLTQAAVSALEKGKIDPTLKTALTIAGVLGVALAAIWVFSESKKGGSPK